MKTHRIVVYNYDLPSIPRIKKFEVDAWCVQGPTGFRAWFIKDDFLYEAHGDDGGWWLVGRMHIHWLPEFKKAVEAIDAECPKTASEHCPFVIVGEDISPINCKITDYSSWTDSSVVHERPKDCPYKGKTVHCIQFYSWDEWEEKTGRKRPERWKEH
jgi:hypothetical protein